MGPGRALAIAIILLTSLLLAQQLITHASDSTPIAAVYVTVDAARDEVNMVVHIAGNDPALQAEVSEALIEVLGSSPGSFDQTRNGSGVFVSVTIKGVLRYITSDEELFINYMNYAIPNNSLNTCLSALGRTGFDLGLLIPEELREIIDTVGADNVVFEVVSPYLNESALEEVADVIVQHLSGQVTVSGNALIVTLDNASGHACVPYESWFWKLFGVPRAVATIPLYPPDQYEVHNLVLLQIELGRVPLENVTAVYTPPTGLVPRCAGWWGIVLCYSNKTSIRFSTPFSTDRFIAQADLELTKPGVYELGEARVTYCLPTSGACTEADIPVYSFQTGKTTLTVREYHCFDSPGYWSWVETLLIIAAAASLVAVALATAASLTRHGRR